jgi:hypothetical protein
MPPLSYCTLKFIECADFVTRLNLVYGQMVYKYYIQQCIFVVFVIYIVSWLMPTLECVSSDI